MTIRELKSVTGDHIFIRNYDGKVFNARQPENFKYWDKEIYSITATDYPMYKHVFEVTLKNFRIER